MSPVVPRLLFVKMHSNWAALECKDICVFASINIMRAILVVERHARKAFRLGTATCARLHRCVHPLLYIVKLKSLVLPLAELAHILHTVPLVGCIITILEMY